MLLELSRISKIYACQFFCTSGSNKNLLLKIEVSRSKEPYSIATITFSTITLLEQQKWIGKIWSAGLSSGVI